MLLLATALSLVLPTGPGATATVNDASSPGVLGDNTLTLDEAILLANGTIDLGNLSPMEQAQVTGSGEVLCIAIDAAITPTITIASATTPLVGQGMMVGRVTIQGIANNGQKPVLQSNGATPMLSMHSHMTRIVGLSFDGGAVAIEADMPAMMMPMMDMPMVMACDFEGQSTSALHVSASGNGATMLMMRNCTIGDTQIGIRIHETTTDGRIMCMCWHTTFDGATVGVDTWQDGNGTNSMCALWRCNFVNGETLAKSSRGPASAKLFMYRIVYTDATCSGDVIDCEGNAPGITMIHHHHGDWVAGAGKRALYTHPRTATFDIHGSEMVFEGDVEIHGNTTSPRCWHQNNEYRNGTVTFDFDGALPNLVWNRFYDCELQVPSLARSRVDMRDSELYGTPSDSQSFLAPIEFDGCWLSNSPMTGFASESNAVAGPFLGVTDVSPRTPQVGTSLQLDADLPNGILMFWDIAVSEQEPFTSAEPVRFYGIPSTAVVLPVILAYQSTLQVPLPNDPGLIGQEFYAQGICLSAGGTASYGPGFYLPRGGRFVFR